PTPRIGRGRDEAAAYVEAGLGDGPSTLACAIDPDTLSASIKAAVAAIGSGRFQIPAYQA
ncbi:MAG: hypothetical protein L0H83_11090, partial [Salinisphaera sp.]|nr:hypothetical protein [Salinisphaera sp.]